MLENLMNLVRENAGESIVNNPAIPNERNEEVIQETGSSLISGLQGLLAQGGAKNLLEMFGNPSNVNQSNPAVQQLSGGVLESLVSKFGIDKGQAGGIVSSLLPSILSSLVSKTNDPSNSNFNLQDMFNQLSGGKSSGINVQGMLGKLTQGGLDKDGDGDVDMQDLMAAFR